MKILIYSPLFYPSIGGLETVISLLSHKFISLGHEVKLVSQVLEQNPTVFPFEVIRRPLPKQLLDLTHWCDIYFQGCVSLKGLWPLFIIPKPLVVTHQTWYGQLNEKTAINNYLKHFVSRFATNICASHALAKHLSAPSLVIPNSYQEDIFYEMPEIPRNQELIFLGRLVSDKGVDLLLKALANIKKMGLTPSLTIVGQGPEEPFLYRQGKELNISEQVSFVGAKVGKQLAQLLNAHQILVVPSRWPEPFGIVALEGIACGCVVVGSESGGLKDAIGLCGQTFPNGNVEVLTQHLFNLLTNPEKQEAYRENFQSHLARHTSTAVATAYLQVMEQRLQ